MLFLGVAGERDPEAASGGLDILPYALEPGSLLEPQLLSRRAQFCCCKESLNFDHADSRVLHALLFSTCGVRCVRLCTLNRMKAWTTLHRSWHIISSCRIKLGGDIC